MSSHSIWASILILLAAMFSIQSGASLAKNLFPLIGSPGTTALRLIFAALLLAILRKPWRTRLSKRHFTLLAVYGIALGTMNYTFYLALERIPLGLGVGLEFVGPLAVALLSSRRAVDFLWALLAALGIFLILPLTSLSAAIDPVGAALALFAGFCWGLYIVFGQRAGAGISSGTATSWGMIAAALVIAPIGVIQAGARLWNPAALPIALAVGFFSSAFPYSLEMIALKRLPAKTFGILMSLEPAIATLAGRIFLNERLTGTQGVAIACIMLASLGASLAAKAEPITPKAVS